MLRPFGTTLASYLHDTNDTVIKLQNVSVSTQTLIGSLDAWIYIQHTLALNAESTFFQTQSDHLCEHNSFVLQLLKFVLEHTYFLFDDRFFHQLRGTAMGTICAPSYANLLLGWWEDSHRKDLSFHMQHILFWAHYIDDVMMLWDHTKALFVDFVHTLNQNTLGLKFISEINEKVIHFLNLTIW